eukprot:1425675-Ditylum_brightwellii.AAC.1
MSLRLSPGAVLQIPSMMLDKRSGCTVTLFVSLVCCRCGGWLAGSSSRLRFVSFCFSGCAVGNNTSGTSACVVFVCLAATMSDIHLNSASTVVSLVAK